MAGMGAPFFLMACALAPSPAAALSAAAGKVDITPRAGVHRTYIAGYGDRGRPIEGVRDPLFARAVVVSDGRRTVALVSVDLLGLFRNDVLEIRRLAGYEGTGRSLFLAATHTHSGPDTLGLWGRFPGFSGVDRGYLRELRGKVASLVMDLGKRLVPASLTVGSAHVPPEGHCRDTRDPVVMDAQLVAARLSREGGAPIATLVNWSCHAEALGPVNRLLSADFPGVLCRSLEAGGGTCLFWPGSIGGMMSPDRLTDVGNLEGSLAAMDRIGSDLAASAESALRGRSHERGARLEFRSVTVRLPVENSRYLLFLPSLAAGHEVLSAAGTPLGTWTVHLRRLRHLFLPIRTAFPQIETEVARVRLGSLEILGLPGEIFPELVVAGYQGQRTFGRPLVRPSNPDPPEVARAPGPPYLKDLMRGPNKMLVGVANDMMGYIIPEYDFKVSRGRAMVPEPPGDHYEETNSIGPSAAPILLRAASALLGSP